jgi:hypothetical protein
MFNVRETLGIPIDLNKIYCLILELLELQLILILYILTVIPQVPSSQQSHQLFNTQDPSSRIFLTT